MRPDEESARILITIKTYPDISQKYRETVCVGGIRLDGGPPRHVRLFPVTHRLLDETSQFKKWSIIEVNVRRHTADRRPESWRPDLNSLRIVDEQVGTRDGWRKRLEYVEPLIAPSLCAIRKRQKHDGTSLGIFRPRTVSGFEIVDAPKWTSAQQGVANQTLMSLDGTREPERLEWIPLDFKYRFTCDDASCPGHRMTLRDWEAGQSYRRFRSRYSQDDLRDKLRERWFTSMVSPDKALHFFVGNIAQYPQTFMLVGLFYPPKKTLEAGIQGDLFSA